MGGVLTMDINPCALCLDPPRNPIPFHKVNGINHEFCEDCLLPLMEENPPKCPLCRHELDLQRKNVLKIKIKCKKCLRSVRIFIYEFAMKPKLFIINQCAYIYDCAMKTKLFMINQCAYIYHYTMKTKLFMINQCAYIYIYNCAMITKLFIFVNHVIEYCGIRQCLLKIMNEIAVKCPYCCHELDLQENNELKKRLKCKKCVLTFLYQCAMFISIHLLDVAVPGVIYGAGFMLPIACISYYCHGLKTDLVNNEVIKRFESN